LINPSFFRNFTTTTPKSFIRTQPEVGLVKVVITRIVARAGELNNCFVGLEMPVIARFSAFFACFSLGFLLAMQQILGTVGRRLLASHPDS
jgi:hypothetical protein